MKPWNL